MAPSLAKLQIGCWKNASLVLSASSYPGERLVATILFAVVDVTFASDVVLPPTQVNASAIDWRRTADAVVSSLLHGCEHHSRAHVIGCGRMKARRWKKDPPR